MRAIFEIENLVDLGALIMKCFPDTDKMGLTFVNTQFKKNITV